MIKLIGFPFYSKVNKVLKYCRQSNSQNLILCKPYRNHLAHNQEISATAWVLAGKPA